MSGIKITKALYGSSSKTVDVSKAIMTNVKDGVLNLVVSPDSLGVPDPAPGEQKTLNVSYTINNGRNMSQTLKDNEVLMISAPPERKATGLEILKAEYGYPGNFTDVTDAIQNHVKDGSIKITVGYKSAGIPDPNPNKQKSLAVEYKINGYPNTIELVDGKTLNISAPPVDGVNPTTPTNYVNQIVGTFVSNFFRMIGVFLYVISVFTTADFLGGPSKIPVGTATDTLKALTGTPEGRARTGYLLIGAALPGVAFWGLPFYVFVRRLFSNSYVI